MTLAMLLPLIAASSHTLTLMLDFVTTSCSPSGEQLPSGIEDILTCKLKVAPGLLVSGNLFFLGGGGGSLSLRMKLLSDYCSCYSFVLSNYLAIILFVVLVFVQVRDFLSFSPFYLIRLIFYLLLLTFRDI